MSLSGLSFALDQNFPRSFLELCHSCLRSA